MATDPDQPFPIPPGDPAPYEALVPPEHADKPKFMATIGMSVQSFADLVNVLQAMPGLYDLDVAVGSQLDTVGMWIGRSRYLETTLPNVYFSFDTEGQGWNEATWFVSGGNNDQTGITVLDDDHYRLLLKATVIANTWDGTIAGAYAGWDLLFAGEDFSILIQDYGDDSMATALIGKPPDAVTRALFTTGELDFHPAGVLLRHLLPTIYPAGNVPGESTGGVPLFGFDADTSNVAGWDTGAWTRSFSSE